MRKDKILILSDTARLAFKLVKGNSLFSFSNSAFSWVSTCICICSGMDSFCLFSPAIADRICRVSAVFFWTVSGSWRSFSISDSYFAKMSKAQRPAVSGSEKLSELITMGKWDASSCPSWSMETEGNCQSSRCLQRGQLVLVPQISDLQNSPISSIFVS